MVENHNDVLATVQKFFGALQSGDIAACEALFTDDGVVWHNYDQLDQPKSEALAALGGLAQLQPQFEVVGRDIVDDVCVQRHVVHVVLGDGQVASIPAIQRISCADGRI